MKKITLAFFLFCSLSILKAQNSFCNKLGAWIWYLESTTCKTHAELADSLKKLNIKRIYIKVADGRNFSNWPELDDKKVVQAYKNKGIEVWCWTYNYPNKNNYLNYEADQAEALYRASKTGYEGLVVDVEAEFDKDSLGLYKLFTAFDKRKKDAIKDGFAKSNFELRVTTWGNPKAHNFNIKAMNPFVDAYMPQTYVEQWGATYVKNMEQWIDAGVKEYKSLGATKPIHHIVAAEKTTNTTGALTVADVNKFIAKAGGETSVWRIPGGDIKPQNWAIWNGVNWKKDFCAASATDDLVLPIEATLYPNPFSNELNINVQDFDNQEIELALTDLNGRVFMSKKIQNSNLIQLNTEELTPSIYFCILRSADKTSTYKVVKN